MTETVEHLQHTADRRRRISDWERRLRKINTEMELFFGDPGPGSYPSEMEMSVNLAWRALYRETNHV